jgi:hypothetical protein
VACIPTIIAASFSGGISRILPYASTKAVMDRGPPSRPGKAPQSKSKLSRKNFSIWPTRSKACRPLATKTKVERDSSMTGIDVDDADGMFATDMLDTWVAALDRSLSEIALQATSLPAGGLEGPALGLQLIAQALQLGADTLRSVGSVSETGL